MSASSSLSLSFLGVGLAVRVLLVEDHDDTRAMMTRLLGYAGYAVVAAVGFEDALEKARAASFDVLVADLGLRDGCGWELVKRLQARHTFAAIAVSGHGLESDIERSRAAGYCEHLTKPVAFDKLVAAVERCRELKPNAA